MTDQPLWVILCPLPEKGKKEIGDEREVQGRKRNRNEREGTEEIKTFPSILTCYKDSKPKCPTISQLSVGWPSNVRCKTPSPHPTAPWFSFQIFPTKLILWTKISLTCSISILNWIFGIFLLKHILLFLTYFKLLMFHNTIVKISEFEQVKLVKNLHPDYILYPPFDFCIFCRYFYYMKK